MEPDDIQDTRLRFDEGSYGEGQPWLVHHRGLEYRGEVIVSEAVEPDLGRPLDDNAAFRVVFFTAPRRIPFNRIRDPRIAMVVPLRAPDQASSPRRINRQIREIRESRERYMTGQDANTIAMRRSMDDQEESLREDLGRRYASPYLHGRIYTQAGFTIRPADVFTDSSPESWADRLAEEILSQAFPDLPFDYTSFPYTLTESHIFDLYRGLFQDDHTASDVVRDFGPGLNLTTQASPVQFDAGESRVVSIIHNMLESRGGEMPAQEVMNALVTSHGLTRTLAALYLMAFVEQNRAEISLASGRQAERYGDGTFMGGSITREMLSEVSFTLSLIDSLGVVSLQPSQSWNAALPYASLVVEGLDFATDDDAIAEQERRLLDGLSSIAGGVSETRQSLRVLEEGFGRGPRDAQVTLDSIESIASASGYGEFYAAAQEVFGGPRALSERLDAFQRLGWLAERAPEILGTRDYLEGMSFGREHQQLSRRRDELAAMIDLDSIMSDQLVWGSMAERFQQLRRRYVDAYLAHHTRYYQESLELRNRLDSVTPQVEALARFNEMPELGDPQGGDVPELFRSVTSSIKSCARREEELSLVDAPYCESCLLALDADIPRMDAETLFGAIERAMREYNRRLGSFAAHRVLAHPSKEQLDRFTNLVQVADPSALVNVLDDEVIEFLRQFLSNGAR